MPSDSKLRVPGLKIDQKYRDAAKFVMDKKMRDVFELIDEFFKNDSPENLHQLRIAIRRFRYVLEIFNNCFGKKTLKSVASYSKLLQDMIGEGRDLDVMTDKVKSIAKDIGASIPVYFFNKLEKDRIEIRRKIKIELIKFKSDKYANSFLIKRYVK